MILWIRHGQSTWNVIDRMQGHAAHPPLTDLGRDQARVAAESLAALGVDRIVTSPAVRATQTARILADHLGLEAEIEPLLIERGLDEPVTEVLGRIQEFLTNEHTGTVVAVSHGDTIGLAVGLLSGRPPELPTNCSITSVDPATREVTVIPVAD